MVITAPPSDVGGEKETLVAPFEAVAITAIGDPGTFGGGDTTLPPDPGATVTLALDFAESDPEVITSVKVLVFVLAVVFFGS